MQNDPPPSGAKPVIERRLATILMADVADYSRMMGANEEQTVHVLRGHREIFDELLRLHRGRVCNTAGDAILAEFPSAVEAVRCATEVQAALRTRNDHLPPEQRMLFRIGINLGDVIVQEGDLLGDGVNVAARIQAIAEPGGICISGSVYDQIQNKLSLHFRQLGEKTFKNIAQPIRTFSITDDGDGTRRAVGSPWRPARALPITAMVGGLIALLVVAGAGYWFYRDYARRLDDEARRATEAQRVADVQRKSEQDVASAAAQHEAKLLAELQAAKDALTQAEASKRKAEQDRVAAEAAQREARLQGELKAAKDALLKAEASGKKADQDRQVATSAVRAAETAAQKSAEPPPKSDARPEPRMTTAAVSPPQTATAGVERFDGKYLGRMCAQAAFESADLRCWPVELTVKNGTLSGQWIHRLTGKESYAKGTIGADGRIDASLSAFNMKGQPLSATLKGSWTNDTIAMSGHWQNTLPVRGAWTRAQ